jgi:hypothetical protein
MIVLDTDHVTLLQWGESPARAIVRRLDASGHQGPAVTTIIAYEEQVRGWMGKLGSARKLTDEIPLYEMLGRNLEFYGTLRVLPFTDLAAVEFSASSDDEGADWHDGFENRSHRSCKQGDVVDSKSGRFSQGARSRNCRRNVRIEY